jgi:monoamine oxidase
VESAKKNLDVIVIGAGAAGITAALKLHDAGLSVAIVESRDRIGGRIFTLRDPKFEAPVELGAEFIHGRPPQLWQLINEWKIPTHEVDGDNWCSEDGQLKPCDFFSDVNEILEKMDGKKPDLSFLEFLETYSSKSGNSRREQRAREWATSYVTGFNAADPAIVGVHWLVKEQRAEEKIDGDRAFRGERGYAALIEIFQKQLADSGITVQKNTIVQDIEWQPGRVDITARCPNGTTKLSAPRAVITVPLGVLKARPDENGAIQFTPELTREKRAAIDGVMMGEVIRVTLRFRQRFWEDLPLLRGKDSKTMDGMSFLLSGDDWFPTWWTTMPAKLPFLVGWAPFHSARRLSGKNEAFVVEQSIRTLHRLLGVSVQELEGQLEHAYFHDWQSDPFSRGAYSYGKVGEVHAPEALTQPVENTLFFAGEATDVAGNNGTVHGAMASGERVANQIKAVARR